MKGDALQLCELVTEDPGIQRYKTEVIIEFVHYQGEEHPVNSYELEKVGGWNKLCNVEPELNGKGDHQLVIFRLYELVSPTSPLFINEPTRGGRMCGELYERFFTKRFPTASISFEHCRIILCHLDV